jgi:hypothetical protein
MNKGKRNNNYSREIDKNENCILVSKKGERKGDMAKLVDATDLHWIEPWYGNLLSVNFQIQRNPGIKSGQS